jgi:sugar/nucleoside kinase (ribokinase family)
MIGSVVAEFPRIKIVATTLREVHSTNRHSWGALAWIDGQTYISPTCQLDVYDRVGGGDGFASGFFYGLLTGEPEQAALDWCSSDHLPRRYQHGHAGAGAGLRQRRLGPHPAIKECRAWEPDQRFHGQVLLGFFVIRDILHNAS